MSHGIFMLFDLLLGSFFQSFDLGIQLLDLGCCCFDLRFFLRRIKCLLLVKGFRPFHLQGMKFFLFFFLISGT